MAEMFSDVPDIVMPVDVTRRKRTLAFNQRQRMKAMQRVMMQAVTKDDIRRVTRAVIAEAESGNIQAATLLYDRTMGKVTQQIDLNDISDRKTGQELMADVMKMIPEKK